MKETFSKEFERRCQENFEDQKNFLQRELVHKVEESKSMLESQFMAKVNSISDLLREEYENKLHFLASQELPSAQIAQIRQEEQAKAEMELRSQLQLKDLQLEEKIHEMNANFNLQREKDIEEL